MSKYQQESEEILKFGLGLLKEHGQLLSGQLTPKPSQAQTLQSGLLIGPPRENPLHCPKSHLIFLMMMKCQVKFAALVFCSHWMKLSSDSDPNLSLSWTLNTSSLVLSYRTTSFFKEFHRNIGQDSWKPLIKSNPSHLKNTSYSGRSIQVKAHLNLYEGYKGWDSNCLILALNKFDHERLSIFVFTSKGSENKQLKQDESTLKCFTFGMNSLDPLIFSHSFMVAFPYAFLFWLSKQSICLTLSAEKLTMWEFELNECV